MLLFLRKWLLTPILRQLMQGVSPARLALALALGLMVGVIPILGSTTLLCALLGAALRLNQPAIQLAATLAMPLQLALYIPFYQAGAWIFDEPPVHLTLERVQEEISRDLTGTMGRYLVANLEAVVAWGVVAPFVGGVVYPALRAVLSRLPIPADPG